MVSRQGDRGRGSAVRTAVLPELVARRGKIRATIWKKNPELPIALVRCGPNVAKSYCLRPNASNAHSDPHNCTPATTNGWSCGRTASDRPQFAGRSQPSVVRTHAGAVLSSPAGAAIRAAAPITSVAQRISGSRVLQRTRSGEPPQNWGPIRKAGRARSENQRSARMTRNGHAGTPHWASSPVFRPVFSGRCRKMLRLGSRRVAFCQHAPCCRVSAIGPGAKCR